MKKQNASEGTMASVLRVVTVALAWLHVLSPVGARSGDAGTLTISLPADGGRRIQFHGVPGQAAVLQTSAGLDNHWTILATMVVDADGCASFDDTETNNVSRRFYRMAALGNVTLALRARGNEDELFTITLRPQNSFGVESGAAFILGRPARGQLLQFDGTIISNAPVLVTDPDHRVQFRAAPDENGNDYAGFRFVLQDSSGSLAIGEATLDVNPVPDAPVNVFPWVIRTDEDAPVIFKLPIVDPDLEQGGDTIHITIVDPVPCISLESLDCLGQLYQVEDDDVTRGPLIDQPDTPVTNPRGLLMFVPKANANGGTVFLPQLEDSYGLRTTGGVWVHVTPVNDPPEAISRVVNVPNTTRIGYPIYAHYHDIDVGGHLFNDSLRLRFVSLPEQGRLLWGSLVPISTNDWVPLPAGDTWVYELPVPDPNDCNALVPTGTNIASYSYMIMDSSNATATATDRIDILDENIPPTATWPEAVTNRQDTTFEMATNMPIVIHLEDRDGDRVYFFIARPPEHGRLHFQHRDETWGFVTSSNFQVLDSFYPGEHPRLFYVPDPGFNTDNGQPDSFSFHIVDWQLHAWRCEPVVDLYVPRLNHAPIADSQMLTCEVNGSLQVELTATDVDGNLSTFNILSEPGHGVLTGTPPRLIYKPKPDFSGIDSFDFNASDSAGAASKTATVTIGVVPVP